MKARYHLIKVKDEASNEALMKVVRANLDENKIVVWCGCDSPEEIKEALEECS